MGVKFSSGAEIERVIKENQLRENSSNSWALFTSTSIATALKKARELGWKDKKVQVRYEQTADYELYYVEPFEKDCSCKGILRYADYFD